MWYFYLLKDLTMFGYASTKLNALAWTLLCTVSAASSKTRKCISSHSSVLEIF